MTAAFANVLTHPGSTAARVALADEWRRQGNPQAELIDLQLAKHESNEINKLIRDHGAEWAGDIANLVDRYSFFRGLVSRVTLTGGRFVDCAARLFELAPIQHLRLRPPFDLELVCSLPEFARLSSFTVVQEKQFGDLEAEIIAKSPAAEHLLTMGLAGNSIGVDGIRALQGSSCLGSIVYITLDKNPGSRGVSSLSKGKLECVKFDHDLLSLIGPRGKPLVEEARRLADEDIHTYTPQIPWPVVSPDQLAITD